MNMGEILQLLEVVAHQTSAILPVEVVALLPHVTAQGAEELETIALSIVATAIGAIVHTKILLEAY